MEEAVGAKAGMCLEGREPHAEPGPGQKDNALVQTVKNFNAEHYKCGALASAVCYCIGHTLCAEEWNATPGEWRTVNNSTAEEGGQVSFQKEHQKH